MWTEEQKDETKRNCSGVMVRIKIRIRIRLRILQGTRTTDIDQPPTANRHQPPTADRQSLPTANRQSPPTMVEHMSHTRSFCKTAKLAVGGNWRLAVSGWWRLTVGGWWRLAVGGDWRLAVGGGRWLAVACPLGRFLRAAVLSKIGFLHDPPGLRPVKSSHQIMASWEATGRLSGEAGGKNTHKMSATKRGTIQWPEWINLNN